MEGGGNGAITCVFVCPWPKDVGCSCWLEHISKLVFPSLLPRPLLTKESWASLSIKYNCNYLLDFFLCPQSTHKNQVRTFFFGKKMYLPLTVEASQTQNASHPFLLSTLIYFNLNQGLPNGKRWAGMDWKTGLVSIKTRSPINCDIRNHTSTMAT